MQFTSLKAFLKPGTMFRSGTSEWTVDRVEYTDSESSSPIFWWGKTRRLGSVNWLPIALNIEGLRSDQRITALLNIYERVSKLLPKGNDFDDERAVIRGLLNGQ